MSSSWLLEKSRVNLLNFPHSERQFVTLTLMLALINVCTKFEIIDPAVVVAKTFRLSCVCTQAHDGCFITDGLLNDCLPHATPQQSLSQ